MKKAHKVIIDIGNSRSKYFFDDNGSEFSFSSIEDLISYLSDLNSDLSLNILIVSTVKLDWVNYKAELTSQLEGEKLSIEGIQVFDPQGQEKISGIYEDLGADRVAKLSGATDLYPDKNIILMDFGTATTVSAIDFKKQYLGGFIGLGLRSSLKALSEYCDALADYSSDDISVLVDNYESQKLQQIEDFKSSKQAILRGTIAGHVGLVNQWLHQAKKLIENDKPIITICCGGEAGYFARYFDYQIDDSSLLLAL